MHVFYADRVIGEGHSAILLTPMTRLCQALTDRILVLDGAMGTMIQAANLSAADFGGPALEGCN